LLSAYKKNLINDVMFLIEKAIESGFWISPDLLKAIHTKILNK